METRNDSLQDQLTLRRSKAARASLVSYRVVVYVVMVFLTLLCLFPFWILLVNSTRSSAQIQSKFSLWFGTFFVKNFQGLMNNKNIPVMRAFFNSLWISLVCAILTVYFSALTAYATHAYVFKGRKFVETFIISVMMIPQQVAALGLVMICMQLGWMNSFIPIILPAVASPVTYFFMRQYMASVLPREVIEASRVDGGSEIRTFHQIVLPIIKPALALQFIFGYVGNWNNYFIPALLLTSNDTKTLPLVIAMLKSSSPDQFDLGQVYVLMTLAIFPLIIVYLIFSKSIIKGVTAGSVKG